MKVQFGKYDCLANLSLYKNGHKAILLVDPVDGSPIAHATVNLPNEDVEIDEVFVKDYSENSGMYDALCDAGIIEPEAVGAAQSGFVVIFKYKLTHRAMIEFDNKFNVLR